MKLSTGKVAFPIEFDNGDTEVIYFNPNDREFVRRVMNFEQSVESRIKKIDAEKYKERMKDGIDINISDITALQNMSAEEMASLREKVSAIVDIDEEFQQALKDELNDIFQSDISKSVFKYCNPTDMVVVVDADGNEKTEMFLMQFINAFAEELKKHQAKVSPAMEKHLGKYSK